MWCEKKVALEQKGLKNKRRRKSGGRRNQRKNKVTLEMWRKKIAMLEESGVKIKIV